MRIFSVRLIILLCVILCSLCWIRMRIRKIIRIIIDVVERLSVDGPLNGELLGSDYL